MSIARSVLAATVVALSSLALAVGHVVLTPLGGYDHGGFDEGAAEIVAYEPVSQRLFVVNAEAVTLDVLDIADPTAPVLVEQLDMSAYGGGANSVAVHGGYVAVAIEADDAQAPGTILLTDLDLRPIASYEVGALPDMVTFTPDGTRIVAAIEGEPNDDYSVDPEGAVAVIDLSVADDPRDARVRQATFRGFDGHEEVFRRAGVRIYGPGASASQDFEPEYVAVSADSSTAYVVLQENNALAVVDLDAAIVTGLVPLGFKDWSGLQMDPSNRDGGIRMGSWPVHGIYQPDAIAAFSVGGVDYLVTANEGDARDYDTFSEEARVGDDEVVLDPVAFPNAAELKDDAAIGRLNVTLVSGDEDGDGDFDRIVAYGARSISVWSAAGELVWDSGDQIERMVLETYPALHNANNDESAAESGDSRSDDKGPEPEGLVVGEIDGVPYVFVGLERVGGVMVWNLSDPTAPEWVGYLNDRPFFASAEGDDAGDLGPEGLTFIAAEVSPTGAPLLAVAHEISGTTRLYEISVE
jgi:hypothetical protein